MEFFLKKTLAQVNQAGSRLNWNWPKTFSDFENVLGDLYPTTWHEVLNKHFPEPLKEASMYSCNKKEDFERAIELFIVKILNNKKPRDLQYIYMAPGGNCRLAKDLLTLPRVHSHHFKEMLYIAKLLLVGDIPKPSDELALQWYYMSYHKSNRKKFDLNRKMLKDETIESITTFFQALFEQKKLDGTIQRHKVDCICKRLLCEASEKLRGRICKASDSRRSQRARRKIALCNDQRRYVVDQGDWSHHCRINDNCTIFKWSFLPIKSREAQSREDQYSPVSSFSSIQQRAHSIFFHMDTALSAYSGLLNMSSNLAPRTSDLV